MPDEPIEGRHRPDGAGFKFKWKCPHDGCDAYVQCHTETYLKIAKEEHSAWHKKEEKAKSTLAAALADLRNRPADRLSLTLTDIGFLKTRGIKIDDDMDIDLVERKPNYDRDIDQVTWKEILNRCIKTSQTKS